MKKRRKSLILKLAVFAFAIYIAASIVSQLVQMNRKNDQIGEISAQLSQQNKQNAETQRLLSESDEQFMESVARQKLNYAKPNERIYVDASGN